MNYFIYLEVDGSISADDGVLEVREATGGTADLRAHGGRRARFVTIQRSPETDKTILTPLGRPGVLDDPVSSLDALALSVEGSFNTIADHVDGVVDGPFVVFAGLGGVLHDTFLVPLPVAGSNGDGLRSDLSEGVESSSAVVGSDRVETIGANLGEFSEPVVGLLVQELGGDVVASGGGGITGSREEEGFVGVSFGLSEGRSAGCFEILPTCRVVTTITSVRARRRSALVELTDGKKGELASCEHIVCLHRFSGRVGPA